jgi:hypothetical protein
VKLASQLKWDLQWWTQSHKSPPPTTAAPSSPQSRPPTGTATSHVTPRGSAERATESTGFLAIAKSTSTHHLERIEGRATRSPFDPPTTARTRSTLVRGQSSGGSCTHSSYVPIASRDGRTSETLGTHRHQHHRHSRALYYIRGQRIGRQTQPRKRHYD